eukprot:jgi/Astpho2/7223/Aster-x1425
MSASDQTRPGLSIQPTAIRRASDTQSPESAGPGPTIGCLHDVFDHLPPQALCCVSCVCRSWRDLNHGAAADQAWRAFYERKWPAPASAGTLRRSWQAQYGSKMWQARSFGGRFDQDTLHGHQAAVRSLAMLPGSNLLATGSSDRTVKLWDLRAGMPVATSKLHGGPVRAVAMDATMLVSSGFHDRTLRVWEAGNQPGTEAAGGFDLSNPTRLRNAHMGPILTLALTDTCLFSGGWDYAVRIWARHGLACAGTLAFDDWVWCVAPRGDNLLVSAGVKVHVHDLGTGRQLRRYENPHGVNMNAGSVVQVEGSRDGRLLFSGATGNSNLSHDLSILAHDLRLPATAAPVATLWQTGAGVWGLSHEDPWLGAALNDGTVVLLNAEAAMRQGNNRRAVAQDHNRREAIPRIDPHLMLSFKLLNAAASIMQGIIRFAVVQEIHLQASASGAAVRRQLQCGGRPAHCVSVGDQWLAAGSGDAAVRTWDFSRAQERAEASRAARQARSKARQQRGLRAVWQRQTKPAEAASQADACPDDAVQESAAEAWPSATAGDLLLAGDACRARKAAVCLGLWLHGLEAQHVPGMQTWQIVRPRRTSSSGGSTIPGETSSGITVKVKG